MQMFMVGGAVRDSLLGRTSNDIDFSVVLDPDLPRVKVNGVEDPFREMVLNLQGMGFEIFLETPEHLTVRARFPKQLTQDNLNEPASVFQMRNGLTADFVLARKESGYSDGRRPDKVEPGTLMDDLARRDLTINAMAKAADGSVIDPFNGRKDLSDRILRAVGDPFERLTEDALRAVRVLRFSVTLGFSIEPKLAFAMETAAVLDKIRNNISDERIQVELSKMFRFDTLASLRVLQAFPDLTRSLFDGKVSLDSTLKQKGRGR